jgi:hypothetical protein
MLTNATEIFVQLLGIVAFSLITKRTMDTIFEDVMDLRLVNLPLICGIVQDIGSLRHGTFDYRIISLTFESYCPF